MKEALLLPTVLFEKKVGSQSNGPAMASSKPFQNDRLCNHLCPDEYSMRTGNLIWAGASLPPNFVCGDCNEQAD